MSADTLQRTESSAPAPTPRSRARRRSGSARVHLAAGLATVAAVLAATASIHGVISDWGWMLQVGVVVLGIVLSTTVVRYLSPARYLPTAAGILTAVLILTVLFFANTAVLGFIPTGSTVRALLRVWAQANAEMGSQVPPVATTGVITFSVCLWAAVITLAVDTLAFAIRAPALAGIPLAMLVAIAALFEPHGAGIVPVALTILGFLLILAAERSLSTSTRAGVPRALEIANPTEPSARFSAGARRSGVLIQGGLILAGSMVALLVLPILIPGFSKGMLSEGTRPSWGQQATNIDPLISLGNDLRSRSSGTVLHYFTDSTEPVYLRTSVIGNLTAERWEPDAAAYRVPATESLMTLTFPGAFEASEPTFTRVITDSYRGVWMPLPANAITLNGLDESWRWSAENGTLRAAENYTPAAADITVMSVNPKITARGLSELSGSFPDGYFSEVDGQYLDLPADAPASLASATAEAIKDADQDAYSQSVAIQDYLRSRAFSYSEQTPVRDGYDGSGMEVIDAFLREKSGYCVHFASTMALMARELGIPSRLVTGYAPGTATGEVISGQNQSELAEFTVSSRNAHAWPELYLPGAGWVAFEPTPGRGVPPEYAPAPTVPTASNGEDPELSTSRGAASSSTQSSSSSGAALGAPGTGEDSSPVSAAPLLILLGLVMLGALPWTLRRIQRANRLTRVRRTGEAVLSYGKESGAAAAWAELVAMGLDHSLPMRQDEAVGHYARRLAQLIPAQTSELEFLASAYERLRYAPVGAPGPTEDELLSALATLKHALAARGDMGQRIRRALWPASLFAPRPLEPAGYASRS
ncbi:transglutaminase TgpA family protein [Paeniglutamicibacter terrestris]|uniref:Transglutaminase domain-containing protein n=1 Tax=Paeniglutamicibacter terrestris TaxID=2723403 RepID=A0ABX1G5A1_9MICC|nr:DUF3488 and transglutaminase-like domain-containing protein [Paeniglutamicibacter terrestris]ASN40220.1 hypothetical protein CGQ24_15215 [Arthrobacter sp. 7749]NKG21448.1 transglutaminase domain-containing protein [Paeniglutamicibacter terrestris]